MENKFTHINKRNQPKMVNVGDKKVTNRAATAKAIMFLGEEIIVHFEDKERLPKKARFFKPPLLQESKRLKKHRN